MALALASAGTDDARPATPAADGEASRARLREIRHRHGLLATGDTPPAPPKQDWLTPRQRALLGQSPFVNEEALLALHRKEEYLKDKEGEYTERAQELTRRIEAARCYALDGWEGADGLSASQAAMLRRHPPPTPGAFDGLNRSLEAHGCALDASSSLALTSTRPPRHPGQIFVFMRPPRRA